MLLMYEKLKLKCGFPTRHNIVSAPFSYVFECCFSGKRLVMTVKSVEIKEIGCKAP